MFIKFFWNITVQIYFSNLWRDFWFIYFKFLLKNKLKKRVYRFTFFLLFYNGDYNTGHSEGQLRNLDTGHYFYIRPYSSRALATNSWVWLIWSLRWVAFKWASIHFNIWLKGKCFEVNIVFLQDTNNHNIRWFRHVLGFR